MIENGITGKTRLLGLIGSHVEHSISPQLHNFLCRKLDIDMVYLPFHVLPENLVEVVQAFRGLNIEGFNVTIPHKIRITELLDSISIEAKIIGAVNTVKITKGKLYGFNTDGQGFTRSVQSAGIDMRDARTVILGAGGAARAVAVELANQGVERIVILNRSTEKASELAELINSRVRNVALSGSINREDTMKYTEDCNILINATPLGMQPLIHESPVQDPEAFRNKPLVCDLIYNPRKTKFLEYAEKNCCKTLNGLEMLMHQGILAFQIWNQISIPDWLSDEVISRFDNYLLKEGF